MGHTGAGRCQVARARAHDITHLILTSEVLKLYRWGLTSHPHQLSRT